MKTEPMPKRPKELKTPKDILTPPKIPPSNQIEIDVCCMIANSLRMGERMSDPKSPN